MPLLIDHENGYQRQEQTWNAIENGHVHNCTIAIFVIVKFAQICINGGSRSRNAVNGIEKLGFWAKRFNMFRLKWNNLLQITFYKRIIRCTCEYSNHLTEPYTRLRHNGKYVFPNCCLFACELCPTGGRCSKIFFWKIVELEEFQNFAAQSFSVSITC